MTDDKNKAHAAFDALAEWPSMTPRAVFYAGWEARAQANSQAPVATFVQAETFLKNSLKPEEISGEQRLERIKELMHWFDRFTRGEANGKWFKAHAYELCYYVATQPLYAAPQPTIAPSVAHRGGDAVHQGRTIGDKAWVDLSYDAFSHMRNKPQIFETQILYRSAAPESTEYVAGGDLKS